LNILVIYQYFGTPLGSWSTRIYELTKRWVQAGHKVTVITSPYDKSDIKADGFVSRQNIEGINLIVIDSGDSNRLSKGIRAYRALRFSLVSIYYALKEPADVVLSSSGPITVAIPGLLRNKLRKTPFVFEVRDLWPLGGIVMGKIRNPLVKKVLLWFEKYTYRQANSIVTCSIGQMENIQNRLGFSEKLHVIPNASDNELFGKQIALSKEQRLIIGDKPYVLHLGSLGFIHNCRYLIEVARHIPGIPMVFVGDGAERNDLEVIVEKYQLANVFFLGQMPKKDTVVWMTNCELSLFTTLDNIIQDTSSPNKVFDSFAAGKPVIQTTRGWIYDLIEREKCGFNSDPQNPEHFALKIEDSFKLGRDQKDKMSEAAKRLSQTQFDRVELANKYIAIISNASN
jgi:glycosyltransferase involved in cell wall biosynthesis